MGKRLQYSGEELIGRVCVNCGLGADGMAVAVYRNLLYRRRRGAGSPGNLLCWGLARGSALTIRFHGTVSSQAVSFLAILFKIPGGSTYPAGFASFSAGDFRL